MRETLMIGIKGGPEGPILDAFRHVVARDAALERPVQVRLMAVPLISAIGPSAIPFMVVFDGR